MNRHPLDWNELRNILIIIVLSTIVISLVDFSGADISRPSILTAIFLVYVAVSMRRKGSL